VRRLLLLVVVIVIVEDVEDVDVVTRPVVIITFEGEDGAVRLVPRREIIA
jgi:hypothetical protein